MTRRLGALLLLVTTVLACGEPGGSRSAAPIQTIAPEAVSRIAVVYKLPSDATRNDGQVVASEFDIATGRLIGGPQVLGSFVTGRAVPDPLDRSTSTRVVALLAANGTTATVPLGGVGIPGLHSDGSLPVSILDKAGGWIEGQNGIVVRRGANGAQTERLQPPTPPTASPLLDGKPRPGRRTFVPRIGALLMDASGRIFAFMDNSVTSIVAEVRNGRHVGLPQAGNVLDATLGPDGSAFALLFDPSLTSAPYSVARIDLQALRVTAVVATPIRPADGAIDDRAQIATDGAGNVWVYASQQIGDTADRRSRLVRVSRDMASVQEFPLPQNAGARLVVARDDRPYLFGGPGRNRIIVFDPATGTASRIPVSAPDGSFVLAIFPR